MATSPRASTRPAKVKLRPLYPAPAPFETVNQLLDAIKSRYGCPSERKLAQFMEWSQSHLRHYRKGRSSPSDAMARQIALKLEIDEGMVVAICHAEREQDAQLKAMWMHMARQLSRIVGTALAVGFVALPATSPSSHASELSASNVYYVNRRRWVTRAGDRRRKQPRRRRRSQVVALTA